MAEKPKVIIHIVGGIVQQVFSDTIIDYVVLDHDKHSNKEWSISYPCEASHSIPINLSNFGFPKIEQSEDFKEHPWK